MLWNAISFLLGDCYLQSFAELPGNKALVLFISLAIWLSLFLKRYWNRYYLPLMFACGFAWSAWYAHTLLVWSLPKEIEGHEKIIIGTIASIPKITGRQASFLFTLCDHPRVHVQLFWRNPIKDLQVGAEWQLLVRLKRIHSLQNKGTLDYEAIALQKGIRAQGYVVESQKNNFIRQHVFIQWIDQIRQKLYNKIKKYAPHTHTAVWLPALMIGERHHISPEDWEVLRNTGTNHLMAIAGLHIGLLAATVQYIVSQLWRCSSHLLLLFPAPLAGLCGGLFAAFLYSLLAGFSIPTQRACIMLFLFTVGVLLRRKVVSWHYWSLTLLIVLCINPLNVLIDSFWLSFMTIALIIYGMAGRLYSYSHTRWWHGIKIQWIISLGLLPITISLFGQASLLSLFANIIAVPWLAWCILPLCFLSVIAALFSTHISCFLLMITDKSISGLWQFLYHLSHMPGALWHQVMPNILLFLLSVGGILLLLLPPGCKGRWLGICWLMPFIFYSVPKPSYGEIWFTLLDVGQGLATVVRTQNHTLVYDTGIKMGEHMNSGDQVVMPYLRTIGVHQLDMLVISHGDSDHIGGASAILNRLPVASVKTSVPEKIQTPVTDYCLYGQHWQWDGVHFQFLYPRSDQLHLKNNSSCVLRIDNGWHAILLTGDIEKRAQKQLLKEANLNLSADLLQVPHHGSQTSNLTAFIRAVHPRVVLYAVGYRNRFHFPHHSVEKAYQAVLAKPFNTAINGAIYYKIKQKTTIDAPILHRQAYPHYWQVS